MEIQLQTGVAEAQRLFQRARALQPRSDYNYISEIQMVTRVVGRTARIAGFDSRIAEFLTQRRYDWYRERVDGAENLLAELALIRANEEPNRYQVEARVGLDALYGDYVTVIQGWTNLLTRSDVYKPPLRRGLIRAYLSRRKHDWAQLTTQESSRVAELARLNLVEEPSNDHNLRTWFAAVRRAGGTSIEQIAEELGNRRLMQPTVDTLFYLYILKFLQADMGAVAMAREAEMLIEECRRLAQPLPHRSHSFEWLGTSTGLPALVHESALGEWDRAIDFWSNEVNLRRARGRISRIGSPASGEIELQSGVKAFFVPAKGQVPGGYLSEQDIGRSVEFCLGFSYDGLRAWQVGDPALPSHS